MKKVFTIIFVVLLLTIIGCREKYGDVITLSNGQIVEGELLSITNGRVVFSTGTADVPDNARVWCVNGSSFSGNISFSSGFIDFEANHVSIDSVYRIVWENTDVISEQFDVDASLGWVSTDIELNKGDIISISAIGTAVTETGLTSPAGQDKFSSSVSLVPGATVGQLVFRIGQEALPVAAGSCWIGESSSTGLLQLAVNVPLDRNSMARGVYSVSVVSGSGGSLPGDIALFPAD